MSPKSTSAMSPSETTCEKPMPRGAAQSSIAVIIAPDWLTKAMSPGGGARCEKLASSPIPRHHDADAVGADEAQQVRARRVERRLLQGAALLAQLAEAGGDDDRGLCAARAEFGDETGDRIGRRRDDREIGRTAAGSRRRDRPACRRALGDAG